ncbi:uncharacterized protein LOC112345765 isoform X1 [Selaginella moellendorffii]|uniref:uncharacterized protein LOC112345765 isoform X1 n=1 Tax=Selaginella moellendorffii TaxID=88036 RepID=UPI000D1CD6B8|nr:uncharacterized protein LOC112345765 isoform X1 [Selaginella moellendorffii]|eukprot:XP_024528877.1 uncharacterized protein LOC112345765 isoform X1 [Selaginella moellendorffii]
MKVAATAAEDQQPSHILLGIKIFTNSADTAGGGTAFRCTASWTRIHSSTAQLTLARLETEDAELEQPGRTSKTDRESGQSVNCKGAMSKKNFSYSPRSVWYKNNSSCSTSPFIPASSSQASAAFKLL